MNGTWRGSGTWETSGAGAGPLIAAVLAAAAVVSYLATLLWILTVLLAAAIVIAVPAVIWMRRWTGREAQQFNQQLAAQPDEPRPAVTAVVQQPPVIQQFFGGTHVHALPGSPPPPRGADGESGRVIQALPLRDAVNPEK